MSEAISISHCSPMIFLFLVPQIPLYGGMEIRSFGSFKNAALNKQPPPPHLIFAVMASPEVLKKTGRSCADTPEQMNLVELVSVHSCNENSINHNAIVIPDVRVCGGNESWNRLVEVRFTMSLQLLIAHPSLDLLESLKFSGTGTWRASSRMSGQLFRTSATRRRPARPTLWCTRSSDPIRRPS